MRLFAIELKEVLSNKTVKILKSSNVSLSDVNNPMKATKESEQYREIRAGIFLSGLSVFAQLYLFQPLLPQLCHSYHISPASSAWTVSGSTLGMALGLFVFSFRADTYSRKRLMTFSLITSSLLTICSALVPHFELLVIINTIKGFLLSGVSAVALAYLAEEVSPAILGQAIALYLSGNAIGGMSGRMLVTLFSGWFGWHNAVIIIGVLSLMLGILFVIKLPPSQHFIPEPVDIKRKINQMSSFMHNLIMIRIFLAATLFMGAFVAVYNYLGFRLESPPFSLPHYIVASVFLMYTIGVVGTIAAGRLSDKIAPTKLIKISLLFLSIGIISLLTGNLAVLVLGLGVMTLGFFATHTLASKIISQTAKEGKSSATSIYWLFYYAGSSIIGTSTGMILSSYGWSFLIYSLFLISLIAMALIWRIKQPPTPTVTRN